MDSVLGGDPYNKTDEDYHADQRQERFEERGKIDRCDEFSTDERSEVEREQKHLGEY